MRRAILTPIETDPIANCFDGCACSSAARSRRRGPVGVSRLLIEGLTGAGIERASVLDVGCGVGGLSRELLTKGAARATGIDLSPKSIAEATRLAAEAGLAERATSSVGDGATATLTRHDAVVLDKVMCCYPDVNGLLANTIPAAGRIYAFSAPCSKGIRGAVAKVGIALFNVTRRFTRSGFRVFVHDLSKVEAALAQSGFEQNMVAHKTMWHAAVYVRATP
jgi:SAM-dependent methyltransferase